MLVAACPGCGAEIRFQSAVMPVKVCDFCRSLVMRNGEDLTLLGKAASLPDDVSPLQIGTRLELNEGRASVVGRMRWQWWGGAWNEWLAVADDGAQVWLGEAMGRFMVLRQSDAKVVLKEEPGIGDRTKIGEVDFRVMDVKSAEHRGAEGEIPFAARIGAVMLNVDLADEEGCCASVQTIGGRTAVFIGHYSDLKSLKPENLREVPGWPLPRFARV